MASNDDNKVLRDSQDKNNATSDQADDFLQRINSQFDRIHSKLEVKSTFPLTADDIRRKKKAFEMDIRSVLRESQTSKDAESKMKSKEKEDKSKTSKDEPKTSLSTVKPKKQEEPPMNSKAELKVSKSRLKTSKDKSKPSKDKSKTSKDEPQTSKAEPNASIIKPKTSNDEPKTSTSLLKAQRTTIGPLYGILPLSDIKPPTTTSISSSDNQEMSIMSSEEMTSLIKSLNASMSTATRQLNLKNSPKSDTNNTSDQPNDDLPQSNSGRDRIRATRKIPLGTDKDRRGSCLAMRKQAMAELVASEDFMSWTKEKEVKSMTSFASTNPTRQKELLKRSEVDPKTSLRDKSVFYDFLSSMVDEPSTTTSTSSSTNQKMSTMSSEEMTSLIKSLKALKPTTTIQSETSKTISSEIPSKMTSNDDSEAVCKNQNIDVATSNRRDDYLRQRDSGYDRIVTREEWEAMKFLKAPLARSEKREKARMTSKLNSSEQTLSASTTTSTETPAVSVPFPRYLHKRWLRFNLTDRPPLPDDYNFWNPRKSSLDVDPKTSDVKSSTERAEALKIAKDVLANYKPSVLTSTSSPAEDKQSATSSEEMESSASLSTSSKESDVVKEMRFDSTTKELTGFSTWPVLTGRYLSPPTRESKESADHVGSLLKNLGHELDTRDDRQEEMRKQFLSPKAYPCYTNKLCGLFEKYGACKYGPKCAFVHRDNVPDSCDH